MYSFLKAFLVLMKLLSLSQFYAPNNWIGIDYFLLNFFATFASVLRLQITVTFGSVLGLQVNSGLQPSTRWEPFVASTMLRPPEPTNQRVEPTILSTSDVVETVTSETEVWLKFRDRDFVIKAETEKFETKTRDLTFL